MIDRNAFCDCVDPGRELESRIVAVAILPSFVDRLSGDVFGILQVPDARQQEANDSRSQSARNSSEGVLTTFGGKYLIVCQRIGHTLTGER